MTTDPWQGEVPATRILTAKERKIHDDGLVSVLKQIHEGLDAAVFEAYGWPGTLTDEEILERLVALNHERDAEESAGKIRWLRLEFQCPQTGEPTKTQQTLTEAEPDEDDREDEPKAKGKKTAAPKPTKADWPTTKYRTRPSRPASPHHARQARDSCRHREPVHESQQGPRRQNPGNPGRCRTGSRDSGWRVCAVMAGEP